MKHDILVLATLAASAPPQPYWWTGPEFPFPPNFEQRHPLLTPEQRAQLSDLCLHDGPDPNQTIPVELIQAVAIEQQFRREQACGLPIGYQWQQLIAWPVAYANRLADELALSRSSVPEPGLQPPFPTPNP